jgi:hypothetical protein
MHILAPIYESKEDELYAADFVRQSDYVDLYVNGGNSSVDHSSAVKKVFYRSCRVNRYRKVEILLINSLTNLCKGGACTKQTVLALILTR